MHTRLSVVLGSLISVGCAATTLRSGAQLTRSPISAPLPTAGAIFRLLPTGRSERDTTTWTTEYQRDWRTGLILQVMTATAHGRQSIDSVLFDSSTLRPIWERTHGPGMSAVITFDSGRVRAEIRRAAAPVEVTELPLDGSMYTSTMDDIVVRHLPLAVGEQTVLRFWSGNRFETDTLRVAAYERRSATASAGMWTVQLFEPGTIETFWIDEASRLISRHRYTRRSDGAESELVKLTGRAP